MSDSNDQDGSGSADVKLETYPTPHDQCPERSQLGGAEELHGVSQPSIDVLPVELIVP